MNWDTGIENFRNYLKLERGLSMNTIKSYEFDLYQFKNFIIENNINESPQKCSSSTVKRYLYKNFSNKKSRSQARSISALKSFFNYLLFEGKINSSPLNDIESPKIENKLPEVLSEDEVKRLISSIPIPDPQFVRERYEINFEELDRIVRNNPNEQMVDIGNNHLVATHETKEYLIES